MINTEFLGGRKSMVRLGAVLLSGVVTAAPAQTAEQRWSQEHTAAVAHPTSQLAVTTFGEELVVGGGFHWFDGNRSRLVARSMTDGIWNDGGLSFLGPIDN